MTSEQLVGTLAGYRSIGGVKVQFTPDEVYFAASLAQREILSQMKSLERTTQLALAPGVELYTFPPTAITGITTFAAPPPGPPRPPDPQAVTAIDHPFHTGDEVYVAGVVGIPGANGHWFVTVVDQDTITFDGLTSAPGVYLSGGTIYHGINAAIEIKQSGMRRLSDTSGALTGTLTKRLPAEIELHRDEFGATAPTGMVINFWEEYTDPITLGVQGIPQGAMLMKVSYYRKPLPYEDISETMNPIAPASHDSLLIFGTYYYMLSLRSEAILKQEEAAALQKYQLNFQRARFVHGKARRVASDDLTTLRF